MNKSLCSIVVSVYNEEAVIEQFYSTLTEIVTKLKYTVEILFVNDGSTDNSRQLLDNYAEKDNRVKAIHFSRNFGHEAAMIAGIDNACGDVIICMDADLQNPPQLIESMLDKYTEGNDIVTMVREGRADGGLYKRITSSLFYSVINHLSDTQLKPNASDFFLISKKVADVLRNNYRERTRFLRGFIQIVGFKTATMPYYAPKRAAGESKYSFMKLAHFAFNSLVSFSKAPLKLGIYSGLLFSLLSVVLIIFSLVMWIVDRPVSGYTTIVIFLSAFAGILLIVVGIIGYYIGFILDEVKGRPLYIIQDIKHQEDR
ncbi:MAG: glycosyltransferase family 2 protein [Salinivirgaceae bacterium]|nr:glycosyltransferase family 2 protein [Salinivirgaceae bacterium]